MTAGIFRSGRKFDPSIGKDFLLCRIQMCRTFRDVFGVAARKKRESGKISLMLDFSDSHFILKSMERFAARLVKRQTRKI